MSPPIPKIAFYRISDHGFQKEKYLSPSKIECFKNFVTDFWDGGFEVFVVADRVSDRLYEIIRKELKSTSHIYRTALGNRGSFLFCMAKAIQFPKNSLIYFSEDDYWHLRGSAIAVEEGLEFFDYVSLYDHPDKYSFFGGPKNPYSKYKRFSEQSQILHTENLIWKTTNSCTLTFGAKVKTLLEDSKMILAAIERRRGPWGFIAFQHLTKQPYLFRSFTFERLFIALKTGRLFQEKRYIGVPLPGIAAHLEVTYTPYKFFSSSVNKLTSSWGGRTP